MTLELRILVLSIVLGLVQIVLGLTRRASSADTDGRHPRATRACRRSMFAAAVLIAHVLGRHSWMTEWGVLLYLPGRIVYLALYAGGVFLIRSLVWNVATAGIALVLLALL